MKKFYFSTFMVVALALGACSSDNSEPEPAKYISISTEIGGMSRVATTPEGSQSFENGDVISVYAWTETNADGTISAPAKDSRVVNNSLNTLTAGKWVASPQMLWKNNVDKHYFIGVYPAIEQGKGLDDDLTKYAYSLNSADEKASDLLVAVETTGITATYETVPLAFTHTMAKVAVNLTFRNQWGVDEAGNNVAPTVASVKLANTVNQATVNLFTKQVTAVENSRSDQTLPEVAKNTRYSSIVIPQGGVNQIIIDIDGKNYTYTHSADINFASGKITNITLTVGRDEIKLGGVTVDSWETASEPITGDAEEA